MPATKQAAPGAQLITDRDIALAAAKKGSWWLQTRTPWAAKGSFLTSPVGIYMSNEMVKILEQHGYEWNSRSLRKTPPPHLMSLWDRTMEAHLKKHEENFAAQMPNVSWEIRNKRLRFCVRMTVSQNKIVLHPYFSSGNGTATDMRCHNRLYKVLMAFGPDAVRRTLVTMLSDGDIPIPISEVGYRLASEVFAELVAGDETITGISKSGYSPFNLEQKYVTLDGVIDWKRERMHELVEYRKKIDNFLDLGD
ncbi:hypothetical protein KW800_02095 [Candidatus Parcubacteria bacterium]|nr:hypothetical protein [Candidatus Parcubacteria bacterium]